MSWFETAQGIITLCSTGVALLGAIVGLAIKLAAVIKQLIKDKNWQKILTMADAAILAAERSGKAGADKKTQVIEAVQAGCREAGIDCDLSELSAYIDKCISFSNNLKQADIDAKAVK